MPAEVFPNTTDPQKFVTATGTAQQIVSYIKQASGVGFHIHRSFVSSDYVTQAVTLKAESPTKAPVPIG